MENKRNDTSGREHRMSRLLDAPVELVWEVWTQADHLAQWWAPNGFTNTVHVMEMRPGGEWHMVVHGQDGTEHVIRNIVREVVPFKRIVFDHVSGPKFTVTVEFEARGPKTLLNWHALFETTEEFIEMVKNRKAEEGLEQVLESLNHYLTININEIK